MLCRWKQLFALLALGCPVISGNPAYSNSGSRGTSYVGIHLATFWIRLPEQNKPRPLIVETGSLKIAGGSVAKDEQFPYLVALLLNYGDWSEKTLCSGSIISSRLILTAAHCLHGITEAIVLSGVTTVRLPLPEGSDGQTVIPSSDVIIHPGYDPINMLNDIAMARLPRDLTFSSTVRPVRLPTRPESFLKLDAYDATVSGWGAQKSDEYINVQDSVTIELRYTTNPIVPDDVCRAMYGSMIRDLQICVSGEQGRNACLGDSGGPLTATLNGKPTQVGIVSFGSANGCQANHPGVYTRVASYIDWILYHVESTASR